MGAIVFRPTCSRCLEILDGETIDFSVNEITAHHDSNVFMHNYSIDPDRCPYCGERFVKIIMPEQGHFPINDDDLMKYIGCKGEDDEKEQC